MTTEPTFSVCIPQLRGVCGTGHSQHAGLELREFRDLRRRQSLDGQVVVSDPTIAATDRRVRTYRNSCNIGFGPNLDRAVGYAQNEFVIVFSSDDLMEIDCAQGHCAKYKGRTIGTLGHAASVSFLPGNNLGAYGAAGGMVTNDEAGGCSPMQTVPAENYHVYHLFTVQVPGRENVIAWMQQAGVSATIQYPQALPLLTAYKSYGHTEADFPVAAQQAAQVISLPMYPELTVEQIRYVAACLRSALDVSGAV